MTSLALLLGLLSMFSSTYAQNVFCYYTNWPQYRPEPGKFVPEDVDPNLCNFGVYAFAFINDQHELYPFEWNDDGPGNMYERFVNRMRQNPNAKTLLAVGGWTMDMVEASAMMATAQTRNHFITTSYTYISTRNFDGLDLDFEYPASRASLDKPEDRENFSALVREMKAYFEPRGKLVTAAVAGGKETIERAYEIAEVCQYLDYINIMTYDFNGAWDTVTGINSPLCPSSVDYSVQNANKTYWNLQSASYIWANCGCPKEKMAIGLGTYGRSFTLDSGASRGIGAPATGPALQGKYTREAGFHSHYEVCSIIRGTDGVSRSDLQETWDDQTKSSYISYVDGTDGSYQWIGFDDQESVRRKVAWVKAQGFGGIMVWSYDLDDFNGNTNWCQDGAYRLINAMTAEWASPTKGVADYSCGCTYPAPGVGDGCTIPPTVPAVNCAGSAPATTNPPGTTVPTVPPTTPGACSTIGGINNRCEDYLCDGQTIACRPEERFDSSSNTCTGIRSAATCHGGNPQIPAGTCSANDGLFTLENHCTFYVNCVFGSGTLMSCPDNTVFAQSQYACVHPSQGEGNCAP